MTMGVEHRNVPKINRPKTSRIILNSPQDSSPHRDNSPIYKTTLPPYLRKNSQLALCSHARIQDFLPGGDPGPTAKTALTTFLSPQLILQFYSGLSMRPLGGGDSAPLIPEHNALISPNPCKKIPQLPESIFLCSSDS